MGLTIDDHILSFEGGNPSEWVTRNSSAAAWLLAALVVLVLILGVLLVWKWAFGAEYFGDAPGRAGMFPAQISSLIDSPDNHYASNMRLTGVDQDTIAIDGNRSEYFCGDNFTGSLDGKMYSDEKASPFYVVPDANGKYQTLNPAAPSYFPSPTAFAAALGTVGVPPAEARVAATAISNYRLGRITAQDCSLLSDLKQRQALDSYDWMNSVAESPYAGSMQKPTEHFMKERYGNRSRIYKGENFDGMSSSSNDVTMIMAGYNGSS